MILKCLVVLFLCSLFSKKYITIPKPRTKIIKQPRKVKKDNNKRRKKQTLIPTRCEGGEAAPLSLLCQVPCFGLGAGLPQRQGEMLRSDPSWTQQSHHVQAQRQKDAEQSDQLEGSKNINLVHGHLLITRFKRCRSVTEKRDRWRSAYVFTHHSLGCFCASSWECLTGDIRFDLVFKIIVVVLGDERKNKIK